VAFLLPFLWFLWKGWVERPLRARLWFIFALGATQGAVGWWMVASGLTERVTVSPYRLGFHLTLACVIFAALLWTTLRLTPRGAANAPLRIRYSALVILGLVTAQIYLGALVAGLRAGHVYNTWPLIDGALVPASDRLWFLTPLWRNFFENELTVQFVHRMTAYILWTATALHAVDIWRTWKEGRVVRSALILCLVVTVQAAIGIATLLAQTPIGLALLHQGVAVAVLAVAVVHTESLTPRRRSATAGAPVLTSLSR
jgi:cytochrome c oxidase assembly protein subunit 15